jgi:hypothetical protein
VPGRVVSTSALRLAAHSVQVVVTDSALTFYYPCLQSIRGNDRVVPNNHNVIVTGINEETTRYFNHPERELDFYLM